MSGHNPKLANGAIISLAIRLSALTLSAATTNVFVDPAWGWNGFENVYYRDGSFWTNAYFAPGSTAPLQASINAAGTVVCAPDIRMDHDFHFNTNAWADASGTSTGICTVVSTFYADSTSVATAGDTVIFSGTLLSNNLVAPYSNSIIAFIKDFNSSWALYGTASLNLITLTNGQSFTISKAIAAPGPGNHVQWGFEWSGPPARSNAVAALGHAALAPTPKPRGATVPWITYEAEDMILNGGTKLGPEYLPGRAASEASGRRCVQLTATGQSVQFTAQAAANSLVVRYSVPDTADGAGADYTVGLYTNGNFAQKLPLTSKYSWLYGDYPFTNHPSAGSPRNFFDEARVLGLTINSNDTVRLTKEADDTASYYVIDFVDLENVAAPLPQPADSLSITDYGAAGDGGTDCTTALRNCINAAQVQGKTVWLPAGNFLVTGNIGLPSGTTIQGAGMWHSKLIGSAFLYNTAKSRRINLNGTGSNIHLKDFAILGWLNYRNDSEGNDGLGGSYGTGSTISRIWVEHTKAAAWILNSQGLVVDNCRFRNTLADGINLNLGMQSTVVTNCTARGTGDDCFAVWPANGSATYPPAQNIITHCTGQTPFLANGGALYGGDSNRIEDCLFRDVTYGCGILLSTTFLVGSPFSGTTVVQRSDLIRSGGFDPGYQWRAALQICLDRYSGISGVNLNNLNINNSVSDAVSIIGSAGAFSNALACSLNIVNYGLGVGGRHALWARNDTAGSLKVINSTTTDFLNDSSQFLFYFTPPPAQRILALIIQGGTNLALKCNANPGTTYHIESATDLPAAPWTPLAGSTTNATANAVVFPVPFGPNGPPGFYRVVSP